MPALTAPPESPAARAAAVVRQHAHPRDQALLLALLEYAPNDKGRANIAHKIIQCGDSYKAEGDSRCLSQVADYFWRNVILPVRVTGGKTPEPRSRLSHSGLSSGGNVRSPDEAEAINDLKSVIELASERDRRRCVISGKLDPESIANGATFPMPSSGLEVTRVAHIIPFSLRDSTSGASTVSGHLPAIWSALECFGGTDLGALMHGGINSLDNVITLSATVHRYFTELQVALEPIPDTPHTYHVRTWGKVAPRLGLPKIIKLPTSSASPGPSPAYLALHCAICRVLWASARAEELKDVLDDLEEVALLAADGSSANLINIAIYRSLALSKAES
ncbi:hypothetical protein BV20DRAFT_1022857 [Pilatotrama ljubarskyi]|nr:hypothetical protein BV20DRAFT_1022857 [Pilatotrama ljubarskyi]